MNLKEDVVLGWTEPLEEGEILTIEETPSKIGGL